MIDPFIAQIRGRYQEGRLIPFVGAGVSSGVTWEIDGQHKRGPSWREVVDEACRILEFEIPDLLRTRGTDLQILEYFHLKQTGYGELTAWLQRELAAPDEALLASRVHQALANLSNCRIYYTTNYDDFLERALHLHGRPSKRSAGEPDIGDAIVAESTGTSPSGSCEVVKFHGDLFNPSQMVISESNYEHRLALNTSLDHRLRSDLLGRALLFIGYSFRDPNVAYLFRRLKEESGPLPGTAYGHRAYIAVADPSDFEYLLFRERNIQVIPINATDQTEQTAELLEAIANG
jgi:hypothetical protein